MNNQANFNDYLEKALNKASQKMGWVLRTFQSRNKLFMRRMWMPVNGAGINSLEEDTRVERNDLLRSSSRYENAIESKKI